MKVRSGFVSNSSSSSFIIGIANVKKENGYIVFDAPKNLPWFINAKLIKDDEYELSIGSFRSDVSCQAKIGDNILYLYDESNKDSFAIYNENDEFQYYDYDLDLEYDFDSSVVSTYKEISQRGGDVSYGAGFDG